ncbi:UDP-glycosyltransferase 71K1-like [Cornus florida]|uniref:UDP-glycosyltransferase 71K1-like n=1 Tax=Cornus florida TaxID=4283 RepID=UPI00289AA398|nr:UDP-glycosyltransferase 71K1-like [Cornus florida]
MMKAEVVLVPFPAIGHLVSTIEFAKRLLNWDQRLSITVLVIRPPSAPIVDSYTHSLATGDSQIRYVYLPQLQPPPSDMMSKSVEKYFSDYIESHKPHVRAAITDGIVSCGSSNTVRLVVDLFCTSMIDVANQLGVPSYVFFTSSAAFFGLMLHLPTHHNQTGAEYNESDPDSIIPCYANPLPTNVLPSFVFNKQGGYASFLKHAMKFSEARGIIVNTFAELEPHALNGLSDGHAPPIYTAGPLLDLQGQNHLPQSDRDNIMKWLHCQPSLSVVLLCFGSMDTFSFSATQLAEMAAGLERSGHRFLWSIRRPPSPIGVPEDYEEVLPPGFLKRVEGRGMVCAWVPQVEVLAHEAVGGFVSHCGWNSILESLWFGVPVVTWPIYAEQQINAFEMVRELGLAVELRLDYRNHGFGDESGGVDVVTAEEIERAVRCLMDGDNPVRKRVGEMAEKSRKAVADGGSSFISIERLVEDMVVTTHEGSRV